MEFVCSDMTLYDPHLVDSLAERFSLSRVAVRALLRRAGLSAPGAQGSATALQRGHIAVDEERRTA